MAHVLTSAGTDDEGLHNDGSSGADIVPVALVEKTAWGDALRLPHRWRWPERHSGVLVALGPGSDEPRWLST
jgi:hypothetical protein